LIYGYAMKTRASKPFAAEESSAVDVSVKPDGLEALIEQITDENRHAEVATGPTIGNEVW